MLDKIPQRTDKPSVAAGERNPLRVVAGASALAIALAVCNLVRYHQSVWDAVAAIVLSGAFLVTYFLHRRIAWLIAVCIIAVLLPANLAIFYFTSPVHSHSQVGTIFMLAFWIACIAYVFWVRARYFAYIRDYGDNG